MTPGSGITRQSSCLNISINSAREFDELAGTQGLTRRFNTRSNKALTLPEAPTPSLVPLISKNLFTKFMRMLMKTIQAWNQEQLEPRKCLLKARTLKTYFEKSHMDCYHFYQQCENYFKTSGAIEMNRIFFAATFLYGSISLK